MINPNSRLPLLLAETYRPALLVQTLFRDGDAMAASLLQIIEA